MRHEKLVRDKIPEIIEGSARAARVRVLSDEEYQIQLEKKLSEEVAEYEKDKTPEELCDILEVVFALAKTHGITGDELEEMRLEKANERGGFDKKLYLIETE
ncbi:MAG: nucleoside triphosphate pyrophosphohydrolase [Clostridia bacterium]|nr:nucleoside triphosphate pyrophosphohydrolase [Clostridia bacterium]